jgi:membrane protein implicated in regulation of membrane protease activity
MAWWLWLLLGLVLLLLELLTPSGFYLLFFGLGALAVGMLCLWELLGPAWIQWLSFSGLSLVTLLLFRDALLKRFRGRSGDQDANKLVGETARALETIPVDGLGRAELRGTTWQARNVGPVPVAPEQRCKVERIEGLTIWIRGN